MRTSRAVRTVCHGLPPPPPRTWACPMRRRASTGSIAASGSHDDHLHRRLYDPVHPRAVFRGPRGGISTMLVMLYYHLTSAPASVGRHDFYLVGKKQLEQQRRRLPPRVRTRGTIARTLGPSSTPTTRASSGSYCAWSPQQSRAPAGHRSRSTSKHSSAGRVAEPSPTVAAAAAVLAAAAVSILPRLQQQRQQQWQHRGRCRMRWPPARKGVNLCST